MLSKIPVRRVLHGLAAGVGVMALVGALGTAAATYGVFGPPVDLASEVSATGTNAPSSSPSATNAPRDGRDGDDGDDGSDGDDGRNGKNGRDGRDGARGIYIERYVSEYVERGGDRSRVTDGGQVAIYPSGGVQTGG